MFKPTKTQVVIAVIAGFAVLFVIGSLADGGGDDGGDEEADATPSRCIEAERGWVQTISEGHEPGSPARLTAPVWRVKANTQELLGYPRRHEWWVLAARLRGEGVDGAVGSWIVNDEDGPNGGEDGGILLSRNEIAQAHFQWGSLVRGSDAIADFEGGAEAEACAEAGRPV